MRILMLCCCLLAFCAVDAQPFMGGGLGDYRLGQNLLSNKNDSTGTRKWSLHKFSGISTSFIGWKGGYAAVLSAPIGLQLNRAINNNVFAFAGVSVAPSYVNFHQAFMSTDVNKSLPGNSYLRGTNSFRLYPRAEVGLSYTNDERTFQISGRLSVERNQYRMPLFIPYNNGGNTNMAPLR